VTKVSIPGPRENFAMRSCLLALNICFLCTLGYLRAEWCLLLWEQQVSHVEQTGLNGPCHPFRQNTAKSPASCDQYSINCPWGAGPTPRQRVGKAFLETLATVGQRETTPPRPLSSDFCLLPVPLPLNLEPLLSHFLAWASFTSCSRLTSFSSS
jgi:hypothetical protein